jgi:hypothetical protein
MSPSVSVSADLQSIMPAPVFSRSSLTIWAVMFAMGLSSKFETSIARMGNAGPLNDGRNSGSQPPPTDFRVRRMTLICRSGRLGSASALGLRDPALGAARQADAVADLVHRPA